MQDFHCKEVAVITKECVSTILVIVIQLHGYSGPNCKYVLLCVYIKSCYQETYWAVSMQWDDTQLVYIQILSIGYAMTFILL